MLAMNAASSSGTPRATKMSRVRRSRRGASTLGMGATLLPRMSKWEPQKIRLGVSACLLGEEVRYDGGHKRDAFLTDDARPASSSGCRCARRSRSASACRGHRCAWSATPPRPRLVGGEDRRGSHRADAALGQRAVARTGGARPARLRAEARLALVRPRPRARLRRGRRARPRRPRAVRRRAHRRVAAAAGRRGRAPRPTPASARASSSACSPPRAGRRSRRARRASRDLVAFHAAHKFVILAHSPRHYARARPPGGRRRPTPRRRDARTTYGTRFMQALAVRATRARHVNVLQHLAGFLKRELGDGRAGGAGGGDRRSTVAAWSRSSSRSRCSSTTSAASGVAYLADQVYLARIPRS